MTPSPSQSDLERCHRALRTAIDEIGRGDEATLAAQVRSMVGDTMAWVVMDSARSQAKARAKLGAGLWWCTERSLAQATPFQVADLKARCIDSQSLVDLCCGIGADTMAMANAVRHREQRTGLAIQAVDRDPLMVAMTAENVRLNLGIDVSFAVRCCDVSDFVLDNGTSVHLDPDRRDDRGRKTRPQDYSPSWDVVQAIIDRCDATLVKLAPAAQLEDWPERHRLWISLAGSVREQTLLAKGALQPASRCLGHQLGEAGRTSVVMRADGSFSVYAGDLTDRPGPWADRPLAFIADPDPAIRAAGLTESFAGRHGCQMLGGPSGFLTADHDIGQELAICEAVIWTGACDDRKLRKTLRSMNCFPQRVKTRGVSQDPNILEKRYRQCGEEPVTLWIGKGTRRQYAVLSRPVPEDEVAGA